MRAYFIRHLQVLFATLGDMRRTPMASVSTILVIAITLLLPALLYLTIKSAQQLSTNWQGQPQISIFMLGETSDQEARLIFEELRLHPAISLAEFISPDQALVEFRELSGLQHEIDFLDQNPLPASIVVMPVATNPSSAELLALRDELSKIEGIESIRLDLDWTDKFNSILKTTTHFSTLLSGILAIALILIVSNTIKLLILSRKHEIEVTKLVGGSNSFVRRPFLYYGMLFGLFGAVVSLILLLLVATHLSEPLSHLANLYQKESLIYQLQAHEIASILLLGSILGWLAARVSVAQHLRHIRPR